MSTAALIDLSTARKIHIIGIGGSGMSAIAGVLVSMGHEVSGSDAAPSAMFDRVREQGANIWLGSEPDRLGSDLDAVVVSTAIPSDDPEVSAARVAGIAVLRRAEILSAIAATRRTIAIAGTHGKTTTSTLLALVLEAGGMHPSWIIGAEITGRGNGSHWDSGQWFVVEADESDGTFLTLGASAAVVTNVEPDHLEHYGGWRQLKDAFEQFVTETNGPAVICIDDENARAIAERTSAVTYGHRAGADYRIVDMNLGNFGATFRIENDGATSEVIELPIAGAHNVSNACAALAMGHQLGVPIGVGASGIASFKGVGRRFQKRGVKNEITFVDDYAHLPSEVAAALGAAKAGDWKRVVAVFQPHRYSRTAQVGRDFGGAFDDADVLILGDVYSAGESPRPGVDGTVVRDAVAAGPGHPPITYVANRNELAASVLDVLQPGDLCLTLGAGDITKLADEIQGLLE